MARKTKKDYLLEVFEYGTDEQKNKLLEIIDEYKKDRAKKIAEQKKIISNAKKVLKGLGYSGEDDEETTDES